MLLYTFSNSLVISIDALNALIRCFDFQYFQPLFLSWFEVAIQSKVSINAFFVVIPMRSTIPNAYVAPLFLCTIWMKLHRHKRFLSIDCFVILTKYWIHKSYNSQCFFLFLTRNKRFPMLFPHTILLPSSMVLHHNNERIWHQSRAFFWIKVWWLPYKKPAEEKERQC